MIPIKIDTSSLFEDFQTFTPESSKQLVSFAVQEIASKFAHILEQQASRELSSTREQYLRSIVVTKVSETVVSVELVGEIANMVELGKEPFDMKPGFLNGPKSKLSPNGVRYNTIPYRIGTPGTLSENFATIMPQEVYKVILNKPQDIRIPGGISSSINEQDLPEQYRRKVTKPVVVPESKAIEMYTHKSSIYSGIQRQRSNITNQNTYISFRRVSENSDPLSWLHPGMQPANLFQKSEQELNIPFEVGKAIDKYLTQNKFV